MVATEVGTPAAPASQVGSLTPSITPTWGTGQNRTAGNVLYCWCTVWAATAAGQPPTPSGWSLVLDTGTAGVGPQSRATLFRRIATGADTAPTVTTTNTGTATSSRLTAALIEVTGANTVTPEGATGSGVFTAGTSLSVSTSGTVPQSGCFGFAVYQYGSNSITTDVFTAGSGFTNQTNDGATSIRSHYSRDTSTSAPTSGAVLTDAASCVGTIQVAAAIIVAVQPSAATTPVSAGSRRVRFQRYPERSRLRPRIKFAPVVPRDQPSRPRRRAQVDPYGDRRRQGRVTPANVVISPNLPPVRPRPEIRRPTLSPRRHIALALAPPQVNLSTAVVEPRRVQRQSILRRARLFSSVPPQVNPPIPLPAPRRQQRQIPLRKSRVGSVVAEQPGGMSVPARLRRLVPPRRAKASPMVIATTVVNPLLPLPIPIKQRRLPLLRRSKTGQTFQTQVVGGPPPMPTPVPLKPRRVPFLRRGKTFTATLPQINPPTVLTAPGRHKVSLRTIHEQPKSRVRGQLVAPRDHPATPRRRLAFDPISVRRRGRVAVPPEHSRHALPRKRSGLVRLPQRKSKPGVITPQPVIAPKIIPPTKIRRLRGLSFRQLVKKLAFPFTVIIPSRQPQDLGGSETDANLLGGIVIVLDPFSGTAVSNNVLAGTATDPNDVEGGAWVEQNVLGGTLTIVDPFTSTAIGWTMQEVDIHLAEFNDETLSLAITSGGVAQNLTGIQVDMFLKTKAGVSDTDPSTIKLSTVSGEIVVTSAPGGLATVSIPAADLAGIGIGFYRVDLFQGGKRNTAIFGTVTVTSL